MVVSEIAEVVTNLNQADDQNIGNLEIIADIYDNITALLSNGSIETILPVRSSIYCCLVNSCMHFSQLTRNTIIVLDGISDWPEDVIKERSSE
ncbi:MAG: hypothetical protein A6F71_09250 [Cycloclasticus sp. symbiont of Poecilosclerida sp. M]|nr:MAG: hypothetical protein A6F71_09250 [Cycloclasticus sp. symbiont of Poecilosclerida sp. M]